MERDIELENLISQVENETGKQFGVLIPGIIIEDDPNEKVYLLLLTYYSVEDKDTERSWEISIGRQNTYDKIKGMIIDELIDPYLSFIIPGKIVENTSDKQNLELDGKSVGVLRFLKSMYINNKISDPDFGLDEYYDSSVDSTIIEIN